MRFTMTFSHVQEMRRSMRTWLTEAKVHLSLKINTFAEAKQHLPWETQTVHSYGVIQKPCSILELSMMEQVIEKLCCGLMCQNSPFENLRFFLLQAEDDWSHLAFHQW